MGKHLATHMGKDDPLGGNLVLMLLEGRVVHVKRDIPAMKIALADGQVGISGNVGVCLDESLPPVCAAG